MKLWDVSRYALAIGAAAALLTGCGGSQIASIAPPATNGNDASLPYHKTFKYAGKRQSFKVPAGVTKIEVVARGAAGAGESGHRFLARGGRVVALLPVYPGEKLYIYVGGRGSTEGGGFNGGGNPGTSPSFSYGYGGGGASDVREGGDSLGHRILVAAGGGGQGCCLYDGSYGGRGGRDVGEAGESTYYGAGGGGGGTQSEGGAGGAGGSDSGGSQSGSSGGFGRGGRGGDAAYYHYCNRSNYECDGGGGGGGGGGYYGGGGGGGGENSFAVGQPGAGGGGGSSYVETSAFKVRLWRGWKDADGDGLVVLSWK